jgi:lipoprotein-anchoring transpeptidase ErfK/SrfK
MIYARKNRKNNQKFAYSEKMQYLCTLFVVNRIRMNSILKIAILSLCCFACTVVFAEESAYSAKQVKLSYEGFPYKKTTCAEPVYEAGTVVTLSTAVPVKAGKTLKGWTYTGAFYEPGASFTMPETDVVLEPVWEDGSGIESIQKSEISIQKVIKDGQLYLIYDGVTYNMMGFRLDNQKYRK